MPYAMSLGRSFSEPNRSKGTFKGTKLKQAFPSLLKGIQPRIPPALGIEPNEDGVQVGQVGLWTGGAHQWVSNELKATVSSASAAYISKSVRSIGSLSSIHRTFMLATRSLAFRK